MNLDPILIHDTQRWLIKACNDLKAANLDLSTEPPLYDDALFHCQQAVEKSMKAFLTYQDHIIRKTHDLVEIGEACTLYDNLLEEPIKKVIFMTNFAWAYRYPGEELILGEKEVKEILHKAQAFYEEILKRIPVEAHPII